jgi:hypothetical protein
MTTASHVNFREVSYAFLSYLAATNFVRCTVAYSHGFFLCLNTLFDLETHFAWKGIEKVIMRHNLT